MAQNNQLLGATFGLRAAFLFYKENLLRANENSGS
jgi:hypothetical protein